MRWFASIDRLRGRDVALVVWHGLAMAKTLFVGVVAKFPGPLGWEWQHGLIDKDICRRNTLDYRTWTNIASKLPLLRPLSTFFLSIFTSVGLIVWVFAEDLLEEKAVWDLMRAARAARQVSRLGCCGARRRNAGCGLGDAWTVQKRALWGLRLLRGVHDVVGHALTMGETAAGVRPRGSASTASRDAPCKCT